MTIWHKDAQQRIIHGNKAETEFDKIWICACGGRFVKNDNIIHHLPDRKCILCGQLVDIKKSDLGFDAIPISQMPFEQYPPKLIIAVWSGNYWLGSLREKCQIKSGPHPPAHKEKGTPFYLVSLDNFRLLGSFLHRRRCDTNKSL